MKHGGTNRYHQMSLNGPETHDLHDCVQEVWSVWLNVLFCPHSQSATSCSCVWKRPSSDQSFGSCSTERTNRRAGWPSLCHHPHLLLRHPGIASLIGWLLCSIRPHRWGPLICGQHRLFVTWPTQWICWSSDPLSKLHILRCLGSCAV